MITLSQFFKKLRFHGWGDRQIIFSKAVISKQLFWVLNQRCLLLPVNLLPVPF